MLEWGRHRLLPTYCKQLRQPGVNRTLFPKWEVVKPFDIRWFRQRSPANPRMGRVSDVSCGAVRKSAQGNSGVISAM
jgi:hypothetical protein